MPRNLFAADQQAAGAPDLPSIVFGSAPDSVQAPATFDLLPDFSADAQPRKPPTPAHTGIHALFYNVLGDFQHLPSHENLGWALLGTGFALAVHPFDTTVNRHLVGHAAVHNFFLPGKIAGQGLVQVGSSLAIYAVGRAAHEPRVSHVGIDLLRAQILVGALTYALKITTHRERPDGRNAQSFPSGHASVTFATAFVLQRHFGWWSVPTFLVASYTAASRLHENRHYLSDVVVGATVGTISGRTVTRHGGSNYALMPVLAPGEVALLITRQVGGGR